MSKCFLNSFIYLCFLLSSACTHLHAHTFQFHTRCAPAKTLECQSNANVSATQNGLWLVLKSPARGAKSETLKIDVAETEVEEDEIFSSRKYIEIGYFFSAAILSNAATILSLNMKKGTKLCDLFTPNSSYRCYLVFQVFRI